ncbi:MAG: sugar kinase [Christensenellales bacterium]|nr:sugar kinase [Christensenellales bacterium]
MARIITFGEIMLRLKSPALERFFQSPSLEATFGGGEANVAVSLANYGMDAAFVTALPNNAIGEACRRDVRSFGVDVSNIKMTDGRMGIYFLETGSNQRPSKVVYDRAESAIAIAPVDLFDWEKIFEGADWFHISGIAPAISASAAELSLAACKAAKKCGVKVSCDLNYRKNLWKYGKEAKEVMSEIAKYIDVAIANEEDFQKSLGITASSDVESGSLDRNVYEGIAKKAMELYPNLERVAITLRESKSADRNDWAACIYDGKEFYVSRKYEITDIVDRVGGGDSFSGGLIYGLLTFEKQSEALEFAVAASCLKHTIAGDYNRVTVAEVTSLMKGSGSGRVER